MEAIKNRYLCGIGFNGKVHTYRVGAYDNSREAFSFSNGSYSPMELFLEPKGSNATYVITAVSLEEIDNLGLLSKESNKLTTTEE